MNQNIYIQSPHAGCLKKEFGKENLQFTAEYSNNWLRLICGGGTGFAIKVYSRNEALRLINEVNDLDEDGVIKYCKRKKLFRNPWWEFDYYNNIVFKSN